MTGVYLHPKHGVNPTIVNCFFCNKPREIWLVGAKVQKFREAGLTRHNGEMKPSIGCVDKEPCDKCKGYMAKGVIMISTKDGEEGDDPYRTGGWVVVTEECIKRMLPKSQALLENILRSRVCFLHDEAWDVLGLPRGPMEGVPTE